MTANMKTVKLTEKELQMLSEACSEFVLGFTEGWEHSGYTPKQVKAYYNAEKKLFGTKPPKIGEEWE
tara:strand:+ start:745 stop:945 length:201 start_codon:yes stop_codon:yes gene_type:complete